MAPLKLTAAVCVVLVLTIQLQAPAAAQGITCDQCGPGCGGACVGEQPYSCNGICNFLPTMCQRCYLAHSAACVPTCTNLCRLECKQ